MSFPRRRESRKSLRNFLKVAYYFNFLEPIEKSEKVDIGRFCGIWEDNREAEEIVSEIYKQRENFKIQEVKL